MLSASIRISLCPGAPRLWLREQRGKAHHFPSSQSPPKACVTKKEVPERNCFFPTFLTSIWDLETSTYLCLLPDFPVENVSPMKAEAWLIGFTAIPHLLLPQICSTNSCAHHRWWPNCTFGCCGPVANLWPHGLQHARLLCLPLAPRVCPDSCPLSQWCYLTISFSVTPFTISLQSFPASGSFPMSRLFSCNFQLLMYKNVGSFLTTVFLLH